MLAKTRQMVEESLSKSERNALDDEQFALPSRRMYPIHDADHVRSAMALFDSCKDCTEEEKRIIATNILKKVHGFNISINRNANWYRYADTDLLEAIAIEGTDASVFKHPEIESIFEDMMTKSGSSTDLFNALMKETKQKFGADIEEVIIVKANNEPFFAMRLVPILVINKSGILRKLFGQKLELQPHDFKYVLEIDSKLLYDTRIKATPREVTAVLMHELGHIHVDKSIIYRIRRAYLELSMKMRGINSQMVKVFDDTQGMEGDIIKNAIVTSAIYNRQLEMVTGEECMADEFIIKTGYASAINNLNDRLIGLALIERQKAFHKHSNKEQEQDAKVLIGWGMETISSMVYRNNQIFNELETMQKRVTPGTYLYRVFDDAKKKTQLIMNNRDTRNTVRLGMNRLVTESVIPLMGPNLKKFQRYIDEISVDAENIPDLEYKGYLIRRIHDKLDDLNASYKIAKNDAETEQINKFHRQLMDLRQSVMATKVQEKRYGVLVKYPIGYEG